MHVQRIPRNQLFLNRWVQQVGAVLAPVHGVMHISRDHPHNQHDLSADTIRGPPSGEVVPAREGLHHVVDRLQQVAKSGQNLHDAQVSKYDVRYYHGLKRVKEAHLAGKVVKHSQLGGDCSMDVHSKPCIDGELIQREEEAAGFGGIVVEYLSQSMESLRVP